MQALFWDGQHLRLETAYPTPHTDETTAVVRVRLAGICATDLQILRGYMGFQGVPGHLILKFFQVDITGMFRMTSSARYFKEGVGSSRPN